MSRYQWSSAHRSGDNPAERARHNSITDGILLESALLHQHVHSLRPLDAPPPGGGPTANLWVPIGPTTVVNGQASDSPRVSGRVVDIAVDPTGQRAYAASANGGVWYSSNAGNTWSPLGGWLPTPDAASVNRASTELTSGCLLVKFGGAADGSADDVYVGTGEIVPGSRAGDTQGGVGVLHMSHPLPAVLADPFGVHWQREAKNLAGYGIYRLDRHPSDANTLVAATSVGLFTRTGAFVENADWTRVTADPFNFNISDQKWVTDVLWTTPPSGPRLWVALLDAGTASVWTSASGSTTGPFVNVGLTNVVAKWYPYGRLAFAVAPNDATTVYVFGTGPRLWRINGVAPTQVTGLPSGLFSDNDQSYYDLAIAVDPDNANLITVAGATVKGDDGQWCAALFQFTIAAAGAGLTTNFAPANQNTPGSDPTFIGNAVHADVHQLKLVKLASSTQVWVCCDGGIYLSQAGGATYTFLSRGAGIAALETDFLSCHPTSDAVVIAGSQDNGLLVRVGNTVWRRSDSIGGDSGGTMFHPVKTQYYAAQYTGTSWRSNGHLSEPVARGTNTVSENGENGHSYFYSTGDVRQIGASQARLAIGTNRIWMVENWDPESATTSWVTLPSNNDPRSGPGTDQATDVYGEGTGKIAACKWADDNHLVALFRADRKDGKDSAVMLYTRGAAGAWTRTSLSDHSNKKSDYSNSDIPQPTSNHLPPLGTWNDIAIHDPNRPSNGSFYVATTGSVKLDGNNLVEADRMDTLWWYDGAGKWYPTTLRNDAAGTKAPAYAVVCDPTDSTKVYVGTGLGVWVGTLNLGGATPIWQWQKFSTGLPEATVQDLAFYSKGSLKLLRAAVKSRGVWEVDLGAAPGPTQRTYLRVHDNDSRRAAVTDLSNPTFMGAATNWPWNASPDIRPRPAPLSAGEPIPRPPSAFPLPWNGNAPSRYWLWVFQTALHRIDPLCRPDGSWTNQFSARLKIQNPPLGTKIDLARWNAIVTAANVFTPPWDGPEPTEADLFELIAHDPIFVGPTDSIRVRRRKHKVDVQVHYRDLRPLTAASVKVSLLKFTLPANMAQWPAVPIAPAWKTAVEQLMSGAAPALPAGWTVADTGTRVRALTSDIDARTPRSVTFDVTFSANAVNQDVALVAIVHSTPDPLTAADLTGATLQDLVLKNHQIALRTVRVIRDAV